MLTELRIENFAIIQKLELQPGAGLLIFTGETGAGKSIILDAIMALVGGKVDSTMVRQGEERAVLEADFSLPEASRREIITILEREELHEGEAHLTLGREIRAGGRSVARVNGRSVSIGLLKELGTFLVDIHGQSEHLSLLDVRSHLGLLDRYANSEQELAVYQAEFHRLQAIRKELKALREMEQESNRRNELLTFQVQEIEAARLRAEEEHELEQERNRLANAELLAGTAQETLAILDEGSTDAPSATDLMGQAIKLMGSLARVDPNQSALAEQMELASDTLSEICRDLRGYVDTIEFNPARLEQVETRLELIHQLKRKYGGSIEAVLAYGRDTKIQLEKVQHAGERITELEVEERSTLEQITRAGAVLSEKRRLAATRMGDDVEGELKDLNLEGARFSVAFSEPVADATGHFAGKHPAFKETGMDEVEFLIAPNPGEGLKPLVKIASGGETSRLMLALKNVLAKADHIPTLIFDEIDQGIGGRAGFAVGEKMWQLGRNHQVMCVTHLPQLAAFGDEHYQVSKQISGDRTLTRVVKLGEDERVHELAQMAGNTGETNIKAAREVLNRAQEKQVVTS
ncbi:MAG TPA: DNA repair protein RecN [Anaerolineaceae bacterium]|nr:DNA repair protein RecN [Anaerolineaceae bacterium]